jgi:hypothetical protein
MLDSDLAYLYEVEVKQLNQAVKRNMKRVPRRVRKPKGLLPFCTQWTCPRRVRTPKGVLPL